MRISTIIFLLISSVSSFADAGNGYRFYLQLISKDSDTINGYLYHYSYEDYNQFEHFDEAFKSYIKKDSINLYSFISTVSIGNKNIDFTTPNYEMTLSLDYFDSIRISEFLNFGTSDRLKIVSQAEFSIINTQPPTSMELNYKNVDENCSHILLTWDSNSGFLKYALEINSKMKKFGEDVQKNRIEFYEYLNLKKGELLDNKILIINYCVPL